MSTIVESIERRQLRDVPAFKAGDTVRVHFKVIEGSRQRLQVFEGICIKRQGSGVRETFTVRKNSFGVGVERTFPLHSPKIEKLEVAMIGDVNRAKLYYLRGRVGKKSRDPRAPAALARRDGCAVRVLLALGVLLTVLAAGCGGAPRTRRSSSPGRRSSRISPATRRTTSITCSAPATPARGSSSSRRRSRSAPYGGRPAAATGSMSS